MQIDFRDPGAYRDAFHRLVCGLERKEPGRGPASSFAPNLEIPKPVSAGNTGMYCSEAGIAAFVDRLFQTLIHQTSPVALLAQEAELVPEPATMALLVLGIPALLARRRVRAR